MNNHRKILNFYFVIQILIIWGCSNSEGNKSKYLDFPKTFQLDKLDSITIPPVLYKENKIIATEDYLISLNITSDSFYRVFSLPDCEHLGGFGLRGKGPNEFMNVNISPDKTKIAMVYQKFPLLRICNVKGDILQEVFINEGPRQIKDWNFTEHTASSLKLNFYYENLYSKFG